MDQIRSAFEQIRLLDREMPGQVLCCFLYVASHDMCHANAMAETLGLSNASSSRNTDILAKGRPGRESEGLDLITKERDESNRRLQILTLTPRGKQLAQSMKTMIYG